MQQRPFFIPVALLGFGLVGLAAQPVAADQTPQSTPCLADQACGLLLGVGTGQGESRLRITLADAAIAASRQPVSPQPAAPPAHSPNSGESPPPINPTATVEVAAPPPIAHEIPPGLQAWRPAISAPPRAPLIGFSPSPSPQTEEDTPSHQESAQDSNAPPTETIEDLEQLPRDPELGVIRVRNPLEDPELGILRIRQQPDITALPAQEPPKIGFFTARFSAANSDNILLVINDVGGLTGGNFYRPAATLAIYPQLGPETILIGTVDVGLQRYTNQPSVDYDDWRFRVGIRQGLSARAYGQLSFTYQELFRPGPSRSRIFDNEALGLTLGRRDPLTDQLVLDSYYQIQMNGARSFSTTSTGTTVTDFSRLSQLAGAYLGYTINPKVHTGLSYQLNFIDYTTQERFDTVQQLLGQIIYSITPNIRLSFYGGWSFGRSSDPRVRFDDTLFGFTIDATVSLF